MVDSVLKLLTGCGNLEYLPDSVKIRRTPNSMIWHSLSKSPRELCMEVFTPSLPALSLPGFHWPAQTLELYACSSTLRLKLMH